MPVLFCTDETAASCHSVGRKCLPFLGAPISDRLLEVRTLLERYLCVKGHDAVCVLQRNCHALSRFLFLSLTCACVSLHWNPSGLSSLEMLSICSGHDIRFTLSAWLTHRFPHEPRFLFALRTAVWVLPSGDCPFFRNMTMAFADMGMLVL